MLKRNKVAFKFIVHFITQQILLLTALFIPAIPFLIFNGEVPNNQNLAVAAFFMYVLYCIFYGYYIAVPIINIINNLNKLSEGNYIASNKKSNLFFSKYLYKEVYEDLENLATTLQQNELNKIKFEEERYNWASGIAHDIKTPLTYITGYSTMLLEEKYNWNQGEKKEFLQQIKLKSEHIEDLIGDLTIIFQIEQNKLMIVKKEEINLIDFLKVIIKEIAILNPEYIYEFNSLENEIICCIDKKLFQRAITNLIINAVTHNPKGTKIIIDASIHANYIELSIIDNGNGMNQQAVNRIFEQYYRGTDTSIPSGGTGLGLSIVKSIVTMHEGTVEVESKLGYGTKFKVSIPYENKYSKPKG
ncbi:sensor histidine kinase [Macrococcus epidermidis]|uniref:sensor histidine kinase n=1 Tax=Macrococcus epidermidis TaxID=1902580 RepID=UPI0020B8EE6E|nr:HAMP domain-containing sensor histidine kinase [Macrococcus epidermidis]UTH16558.1 HAMP domain-containing histidine kinase [Macrococcus epidermidis]